MQETGQERRTLGLHYATDVVFFFVCADFAEAAAAVMEFDVNKKNCRRRSKKKYMKASQNKNDG